MICDVWKNLTTKDWDSKKYFSEIVKYIHRSCSIPYEDIRSKNNGAHLEPCHDNRKNTKMIEKNI